MEKLNNMKFKQHYEQCIKAIDILQEIGFEEYDFQDCYRGRKFIYKNNKNITALLPTYASYTIEVINEIKNIGEQKRIIIDVSFYLVEEDIDRIKNLINYFK